MLWLARWKVSIKSHNHGRRTSLQRGTDPALNLQEGIVSSSIRDKIPLPLPIPDTTPFFLDSSRVLYIILSIRNLSLFSLFENSLLFLYLSALFRPSCPSHWHSEVGLEHSQQVEPFSISNVRVQSTEFLDSSASFLTLSFSCLNIYCPSFTRFHSLFFPLLFLLLFSHNQGARERKNKRHIDMERDRQGEKIL